MQLRRARALLVPVLVFAQVMSVAACRSPAPRTSRPAPEPLQQAADPARWARSMVQADRARAARDLDAMQDAAVAAFVESLRFANTDPRAEQTNALLREVIRALDATRGRGGALPFYGQLASGAERAGEPLHPLAALYRRLWVTAAFQAGRLDEAERVANDLVRDATKRFGAEDPQTLSYRGVQARIVGARNEGRKIELLESAVADAERALGPSAPAAIELKLLLGKALFQSGRADDAEALWSTALEALRRSDPFGANTAALECELGSLTVTASRPSREAEQHFERCRSILETAFGPKSPEVVNAMLRMQGSQRDRGDFAASQRTAVQALELAEGRPGEHDAAIANVLLGMAIMQLHADRRGPAAELAELHGEQSPLVASIDEYRVPALEALGRRAEARQAALAIERREQTWAEQLDQAPETPSAAFVFEADNYRYELPGPDWIVLPRDTLKERTDLVLMRRAGPVYFQVDGWPVGSGSDLGALIARDVSILRSAGGEVRITASEAKRVAGVAGRRLRIDWIRESRRDHLVRWYGLHNGFYFIARGWSRGEAVQVLEATEAALGGFSLLDRSRVANAPEREAPQQPTGR